MAIDGAQSLCYVPYSVADAVMAQGVVTVEGQAYPLDRDAEREMTRVPEDASMRLLRAGGLSVGDWVILVPVDTDLDNGFYTGVAVTEDLHPISLLLQ